MDAGLLLTAAVMGLAGMPHCAAMCAAPCAAVARGCGGERAQPALWGWQIGRVASYALAGALVASSVALLAAASQATPWLRPLWGLLHAAALMFGLWMLWRGRWPAWLDRAAQRLASWSGVAAGNAPADSAAPGVAVLRWNGSAAVALGTPVAGAVRAGGFGGLWALMPCGLLQSALLVAALASGPWQGAAVMAVFALSSAAGPWLGGAWLWSMRAGSASPAWATRLAGASLAVASGWALGHGLWTQLAEFCS